MLAFSMPYEEEEDLIGQEILLFAHLTGAKVANSKNKL